jgi:hypothetical protein|nr:hypothetical protein Q903MT_gene636 [Picea sitchensis]
MTDKQDQTRPAQYLIAEFAAQYNIRKKKALCPNLYFILSQPTNLKAAEGNHYFWPFISLGRVLRLIRTLKFGCSYHLSKAARPKGEEMLKRNYINLFLYPCPSLGVGGPRTISSASPNESIYPGTAVAYHPGYPGYSPRLPQPSVPSPVPGEGTSLWLMRATKDLELVRRMAQGSLVNSFVVN